MTPGRNLSYVQAIGEALVQIMHEDSRVFLIGEGVDNITGIYGITLPAYQKFGPQKVIDAPISENGLTGICIGAALDGLRPVLFHQRNDFMMLTMDQLVNHAAKIGFVSNGRHKVPLTIVSFIARKVGEGVQHSQSFQALFAHIPGLKVVMPSSPYDAKGLLLSAIEDENPVIVLYHRTLFDEIQFVPRGFYKVPIGSARIIKPGKDITIIATSATIMDAQHAIDILQKDAIDPELIDLRSIRPLDKKLIIDSVKKTGRVVVVDTGWKTFGVTAEVVATISEGAFSSLKCSPKRIGMMEVPCPASPYLLKDYHPTKEQIVSTVREMMK
jgi:pyruvate dehydrogenase E1 component beta subunit